MRFINSALAVIVFVLLSSSAFSQKGSSFIGLSGGVSIPTGNWGKADYIVSIQGYQNDPAGFAAIGGIVQLNGAYFFSKHIGVGGLISYGTYKTKNLDTLSGGYRESFDVDQVITSANSYEILNVLPGLYFNFPVDKNLSITARTLAGITSAKTPQYAVSVKDGGVEDGTFYQESAFKTAFAFNVGAGVSYDIFKQLFVDLRADYFYSKPDFTIENTQRQNAAGRLITSYNEPLQGANITLGVSYHFGAKTNHK